MALGKRIYWVLALVVVMALAAAAVTMVSSMTSAVSSDDPAQTCDCDQQDGPDDAIEGAAKNGPDLDNIEGQFGHENGADDLGE